jgi:deoxyribodipyrimidine photo-lyase
MNPVIVWFRQDLRLADHRALAAAIATGGPVIPLYIHDDRSPGVWKMGGASRWWLHHSLRSLEADLEKRGSRLILRSGPATQTLAAITLESGATAVFTQAAHEPWASALETEIHKALAANNVPLKRLSGALLKRPDALRTKTGNPFKVYTPFWRALLASAPPADPLPAPQSLPTPMTWPLSDPLASWHLLPTTPDWSKGFTPQWTPGEAGASKRLEAFLQVGLVDYDTERNRPDHVGTSQLSPHLHFGEISPATCWHAARTTAEKVRASGKDPTKGLETFHKELAWRDFAAHLLVHWPTLPDAPFKPEFAAFPWADDANGLRAWQVGQTGYPIVDAGMRQLWHTGWMHNRVRMITASFLIKDLLIPWQLGEAWFWDCLVDADLASNAASWQWVAGCGADAAPYFRIFNPGRQGAAYDPDGAYVKQWVPELAKVPAAHIHEPWMAPPLVLAAAGVTLGKTYPHPIVDHTYARDRALNALKSLKTSHE